MSRKTTRRAHLLVTSAILGLSIGVGGCNASVEPPPSAQPAPPAATAAAPALSPTVSINAVMVALVDHAAHELWNAERTTPKTDADWRAIEHHAIQLAAVGPVLTAGGTGDRDKSWSQSPSWAGHVRKQTDAAMAALEATRARNLEALVAANGRLVDACEACHKEFKPDLPSEGIIHVHAH